MSTVIWVNFLKDGVVSSDESDKWALYRFAARLDQRCRQLGVRPLSDFHDTTDARANILAQRNAETDTYQQMAREGRWFEPNDGMAVIEALLGSLRRRPVRFGLLSNSSAAVVAELEECRRSLERAAEHGARFHLCVVV